MQSRPCNSQYAVEDGLLCQSSPTTYHRSGSTMSNVNFILRSAFLRMTLVATSTVVTVTAFALLAIGLSELLSQDGSCENATEPMVLAVAGVLLLATSIIQFVCVCGWSGWCSVLPRQSFRVLDHNQIYVNGQLIRVQDGTGLAAAAATTTTTSAAAAAAAGETTSSCPKSPSHNESDVLLNSDPLKRPAAYTDQLTPGSFTSAMADASTSTRGDLHYMSARMFTAPIALQEEITPSLRSSFQSFDDIL